MRYVHQNRHWPNFHWDEKALATALEGIHYSQGKLIGRMESLGFPQRNEAILNTLSLDVIKSSEIEGEILSADQVRSSIARRLGIDIAGLIPSDRNVDGVVEMMLDATQNYEQALTARRLFGWHAALFPTGRSGIQKIVVADWRNNTTDDPMQVVSGPMGRERIHYEAPDSKLLKTEMKAFISWFNGKLSMDSILKAAVVHLWFVTIHPFDDGNGRIGRAITDMLLTRADGTPQRFYSMSAQIRLKRNEYYEILERTQKGTLDITEWLEWFLDCLSKALLTTNDTLTQVVRKSHFWEKYVNVSFNERQRLMMSRLLDKFEGNLTSTKWAKITRCSHDTALRDIKDLVKKRILKRADGGSRNTNYVLEEVD